MLENLLMYSSVPPKPTVPDDIGVLFEGGHYAGKIVVDGKKYALIVSPKPEGETFTNFSNQVSVTPGAVSKNDGWANTQAMIAAGIDLFPSAKFCRSLTINGFDDWYLPSIDELALCYRVFKPSSVQNTTKATGGPNGPVGYNPSSDPVGASYTPADPAKTTIPGFMENGSQAFLTVYGHWSSTWEVGKQPWYHSFFNGVQAGYYSHSDGYIRAVRRVPIE